MPLQLNELLPDEDYRFHLTLRKGNLGAFFSNPDSAVLDERRRWLGSTPDWFSAAEDSSEKAVDEMWGVVRAWAGVTLPKEPALNPLEKVRSLGGALAADFMLMTRDEAGTFRLRAGAVCFPSSWALEDKMGSTLEEIHGHVPGLNPAIGASISQFLGRLGADVSYERANWGLSASSELNLHPRLSRPRISTLADPAKVWLRIEDQIFAALPASGAILFGIQIRLVPFTDILGDPRLKQGFLRAMATMSEDLAAYKGLALIRKEVAEGRCD